MSTPIALAPTHPAKTRGPGALPHGIIGAMKKSRWALIAAVIGGAGACASAAPPLVMLIEASALMPQARIEGGRVVEGLHADLGAAIARRLGRDLVMRPVPRKRLAQALERGEGELLCDYQSDWLPGPFGWSRPFIPDQALLVTAAAAPAPASLLAVAGQPVGTVLGYVYPEMADLLRAGFIRDDAPDAMANLRKLELGRLQHALTGRRVLEYQQHAGTFRLALHPPLVVSEVLAQCALGPAASVSLQALNGAISGMMAEGELARILGKYR